MASSLASPSRTRLVRILPRVLAAGAIPALAAVIAIVVPEPPSPGADTVAFERCTIGDARARLSAECATITVPLDHDAPDGESIELAVARIRARRDVPGNVPFTLLAGGPGQSAIESWPAVGAYAFRHIARQRDVILVDQRGTGASSRLDCPATDTLPTSELDANPDATPAEIRAQSSACLASLDADPRLFTSSVAVRDLERVRERLGIERWNLYGVSYGTRVAQHYARRHPERVRTLILDGVVPADVPLGPDIAPFADRALSLIFARCAGMPDCGSRFPGIGARTRAWIETLEKTPLELDYEDIVTGERRSLRFTARHLASVLRLMSYSAQTAALMPSMLDAAITDGYAEPLARQVELQGEMLGASLASGMHHAVVCTEDAPRLAPDAEAASRDTYLGALPVESLRASCADWPRGVLDADFFEPLSVDVPTLLLSGEADPITPPAYGERVAATLPRARHVVGVGRGHVLAPLGCLPTLMARFVDTADPEGLETGCVERLEATPFFVDANGPLP